MMMAISQVKIIIVQNNGKGVCRLAEPFLGVGLGVEVIFHLKHHPCVTYTILSWPHLVGPFGHFCPSGGAKITSFQRVVVTIARLCAANTEQGSL